MSLKEQVEIPVEDQYRQKGDSNMIRGYEYTVLFESINDCTRSAVLAEIKEIAYRIKNMRFNERRVEEFKMFKEFKNEVGPEKKYIVSSKWISQWMYLNEKSKEQALTTGEEKFLSELLEQEQ